MTSVQPRGRIRRAKVWNDEVEEAFRLQQSGWLHVEEYKSVHGELERWDNRAIKCTRVKSNGYFTYWRRDRECQDKYIPRVKLYSFD